MDNSNYARACTEVLEIISHLSSEEFERIPIEEIEFYKNNMDKEYFFRINPQIDLSKQNISIEANAIIVNLYIKYFATEEQKKILKEILYLNQEKVEQEKRKRYNPDNLFKKENIHEKK